MAANGDRLSVTLTNQLAEIERLAGMVEEFGRRHELPTKAVFDINLSHRSLTGHWRIVRSVDLVCISLEI